MGVPKQMEYFPCLCRQVNARPLWLPQEFHKDVPQYCSRAWRRFNGNFARILAYSVSTTFLKGRGFVLSCFLHFQGFPL